MSAVVVIAWAVIAVASAVLASRIGHALGMRRRERDQREAAGGLTAYLQRELWSARNEAYRWKRRALRLGWRRDETRWDR